MEEVNKTYPRRKKLWASDTQYGEEETKTGRKKRR